MDIIRATAKITNPEDIRDYARILSHAASVLQRMQTEHAAAVAEYTSGGCTCPKEPKVFASIGQNMLCPKHGNNPHESECGCRSLDQHGFCPSCHAAGCPESDANGPCLVTGRYPTRYATGRYPCLKLSPSTG